jgi:hypothetical protein
MTPHSLWERLKTIIGLGILDAAPLVFTEQLSRWGQNGAPSWYEMNYTSS